MPFVRLTLARGRSLEDRRAMAESVQQALVETAGVPADVASFTGRDGARIVEPGALELRLGGSAGDIRLTAEVTLTGPIRTVDHRRRLHCDDGVT